MLVETQKDMMTIERHVRIIYAPARQPTDRMQESLKEIDKLHKSRDSKQKKLRKALDVLYLLYSQSPTLQIPDVT